jgi:hypothetical protein
MLADSNFWKTARVTPERAAQVSVDYYGEELKEAQAEIVALVLNMELPRVAILGATQIQKSRAAAKALGLLAATGYGITIVAPKEEQAVTPLQYFIEMIDRKEFFQNLMLQGGEQKVERLKSNESKKFISFKDSGHGTGHIRAITLNERDNVEKRRSVLGKGDEIIVFEEASLTSNETEAVVLRMIAGWPNGRIIKLGNAITRETYCDHYYRALMGEDNYVSLTVDGLRAVREGIYTQTFLNEASKRPQYESLYLCKFPDPSGLVQGGYTRLFKLEQIIMARIQADPKTKIITEPSISPTDRPVIGIDVGSGRPDKTSIVAKYARYAKRVYESSNDDPMAQIGEYQSILKELNPSIINVDATGMGYTVGKRLRELGFPAKDIIVGASAPVNLTGKADEGYRNVKAWAFFQLYDWIVNLGGKLGEGDWNQLTEVAFKTQSDKNRIIESKDELKARGVLSYNDADALMLCLSGPRIGTYGSNYKPELNIEDFRRELNSNEPVRPDPEKRNSDRFSGFGGLQGKNF